MKIGQLAISAFFYSMMSFGGPKSFVSDLREVLSQCENDLENFPSDVRKRRCEFRTWWTPKKRTKKDETPGVISFTTEKPTSWGSGKTQEELAFERGEAVTWK